MTREGIAYIGSDNMKNVTPGFKDWENITVYSMRTVDNVRFMVTSEGIDIMYADADRYLVPAGVAGAMGGCEVFEYELTEEDMNAPDMDEVDCFIVKAYVEGVKDFIDPVWYRASRRL